MSLGDDAGAPRARVILNEPVGLLDYRVPPHLQATLRPGQAVRVPLGRRRTSAYVATLETGQAPEGITLKDLEGLDPERPSLPAKLIELILFSAAYYEVTPGEVLAAALPAMARPASPRYRITPAGLEVTPSDVRPDDAAALAIARKYPKGFTVVALERELDWTRRAASARLKRLIERGWLQHTARAGGPRATTAYQRVDAPAAAVMALQPRARALLELIPSTEPVPAAQLAEADAGAYVRVKKLEKLGLVKRSTIVQRLTPHQAPEQLEAPPTLTADQARALETLGPLLEARRFASFLLEGVTGSGKTEVYLRIIDRALAQGRTALVLVPEIALTPQLGARFRNRFGDRVATFHSGLTAAERRDEWERVATGQARIGLGARSALFLPLTDLGVIIVDEEHETSFKQEEAPRYNARDLAVVRGRHEGAVVVLGSATPSLESRANAEQGRYRHVLLPTRVAARPLPAVESIDLVHAERVGEGIFTKQLADAIERTLSQDEQIIVFLNRRGFASYVYCHDCGHAFRCESCDVSLTLHRSRDVLACHHCGHEEASPEECPGCHGLNIESYGLGTERLEAELHSLFGDVPVARLDRDTVRKRSDLERALTRFSRGEARMLIGTQMVAKGHDFPGVTLVGVVFADAGLNFPDFRAAERTFQLLTQVAGRAGRGDKPGAVLVQAYETRHYAIQAAAAHDYDGFVRVELRHRKELGYPPYTHLALVRFEAESESAARDAAAQVTDHLQRAARGGGDRVQVLGPALAPIARIKGRWRMQVLLKGETRPALREVIRAVPRNNAAHVRQILDVDPITML